MSAKRVVFKTYKFRKFKLPLPGLVTWPVMVFVSGIKPLEQLLVEDFVTLWDRSGVKYVRFFFMLKAFIAPVVRIGYDSGLGSGRLDLNYWKYKGKGAPIFK